jgi:hypothetical protein
MTIIKDANHGRDVAMAKARAQRQPADSEPDDFDQAVTTFKEKAGLTATQAMRAARLAHPDLYAASQRNGAVTSADYGKSTPKVQRQAEVDFQRRVDEIARQRNIPRHVAMGVLRKEDPAAYRALTATDDGE